MHANRLADRRSVCAHFYTRLRRMQLAKGIAAKKEAVEADNWQIEAE